TVTMSPIKVDEDLLPTTVLAIRLTKANQPAGWLVGEFNLEEMWRMVDHIRIGDHGYALVVAPGGELIAHGDPDKKTLVAKARNMGSHPLVAAAAGGSASGGREYVDENGRRELGVAATIPSLGWTVIVEQPTAEAFANASQLQRQLTLSISFAVVVMIAAGYLFGRRYFINPILKLKHATHEVAKGQLQTRV